MARRRVNPNRRPATQADMARARLDAADEAMRRTIYLMLYILIDKHDAPYEDIQQLAKEINYAADSVARGYVSWEDIERLVVEEFDVYLDW